jgi:putative membrane protein (TIGR04086 family)
VALIDLDGDALRRGIAVAAAVSVPTALISWLFVDGEPGESRPLLVVFSLLVLAGLVIGAAVAARWQRTGTPLTHGLVTTVVVWAGLTVIRLVRLAWSGDGLDLAASVSNLLLSLVAGAVGGLIGGRLAGRTMSGGPA